MKLMKLFCNHSKAARRGLLVVFSIGSFCLPACQTTEEGLITGALIGAALGGIAGHSNERSDRYYRGSGHGGYGGGYEGGYAGGYEPARYECPEPAYGNGRYGSRGGRRSYYGY